MRILSKWLSYEGDYPSTLTWPINPNHKWTKEHYQVSRQEEGDLNTVYQAGQQWLNNQTSVFKDENLSLVVRILVQGQGPVHP